MNETKVYCCRKCGAHVVYLLEGERCKDCYPWEAKRADIANDITEKKERASIRKARTQEVKEKHAKNRMRRAMMKAKMEGDK